MHCLQETAKLGPLAFYKVKDTQNKIHLKPKCITSVILLSFKTNILEVVV